MRDTNTSRPSQTCVATTGEVFDSGEILEVVSDPSHAKRLSLASWDGQEVSIGGQLKCMGRVYEPATMDPRMLQSLRLPKAVGPAEPPRKLLWDMSSTLQRYSGLSENCANLLAYLHLSTWVIDAIPVAPRFSILGTETIAMDQVLRLSNCLCRRAVILTEVDVAGLSSLSLKWQPTILIKQPRLSDSLQRLLRVTCRRNVHVPRKGRLVDFFCAVATFTEPGNGCLPQSSSGIEISVSPSSPGLAILTESEEREIGNHFQDRLLGYRLRHYRKVLTSTFDAPQFTFGIRGLAQSFGRCAPDDTELQQNLIQLLAARDTEIRSEKWTDLSTVAVEALLAACHEPGLNCVYIGEIAEEVEVILTGRGENRTVSAREVAERIRALGLVTEPRDSKGFKLRLTQIVRRRAHELAYSLAAPTLEAGAVLCEDCASGADHGCPIAFLEITGACRCVRRVRCVYQKDNQGGVMNDDRRQRRRRELAYRLHGLGVPLEIPPEMGEDNFIIRQQGGIFESCAFDLSCGGTGFVIDLCILMNKSGLAIDHFALEVAWEDASWRWLEDPKEIAAPTNVYRFPGSGPEFPRNVVINHVANLNRQWSKGQSVKGLLLGVGSKAIPTDFRHGDLTPALIRVVDQYDATCLCPIELWIDRSAKLSISLQKKPRRKLFESPDVEASTSTESELKSESAK